MELFLNYSWPGNVRQLENTCHWLAVMTSGKTIHLSDLPEELQPKNQTPSLNGDTWQQGVAHYAENMLQSGKDRIADEIIPDVERVLIDAALKKTHGRKHDAAKLLGWGRN